MSIRLQNGSRVCIIGGGPAGSFSALHLLKLAQEHGIHLDVLIFEPRDFCAGAGVRAARAAPVFFRPAWCATLARSASPSRRKSFRPSCAPMWFTCMGK